MRVDSCMNLSKFVSSPSVRSILFSSKFKMPFSSLRCNFFLAFCFFLLQLASPVENGPNSTAKRVVLARVFIFRASESPDSMASQPIGVVDIAETVPGTATLNGTINGLSAGDHGFHFHQFGDLSKACMGAGAHFNPHGKRHGAPNAAERHVGDLGNVVANAEGVAVVDIRDHLVALNGVNSVVGRALVVHDSGDDLGLGGNEESAKTGNAGKRFGCGVVGVLKEQ